MARTSPIPPRAAEPRSALRRPLKPYFQTSTGKTTSATQAMVLAIEVGITFSSSQAVPNRTAKAPPAARIQPALPSSPTTGPLIFAGPEGGRSEEHTSELQSLMRISYAVFCLKKKKSTDVKNMIANTNNHK